MTTMQTIAIPLITEMPVGICVTTEFVVYRGRNSYKATMQRDTQTKWQIIVSAPADGTGHEAALTAWVSKFTGIGSDGFSADYEVAARGSEHGVYRWILVPTNYN
jgi:hypothetical protein